MRNLDDSSFFSQICKKNLQVDVFDLKTILFSKKWFKSQPEVGGADRRDCSDYIDNDSCIVWGQFGKWKCCSLLQKFSLYFFYDLKRVWTITLTLTITLANPNFVDCLKKLCLIFLFQMCLVNMINQDYDACFNEYVHIFSYMKCAQLDNVTHQYCNVCCRKWVELLAIWNVLFTLLLLSWLKSTLCKQL